MHDLTQLCRQAWPDLSSDEARLVDAAATGEELEFVHRADIRPEVIRWLCTDLGAKALVDPRGIQAANIHVTGSLDLRNVNIEFYIRLQRSRIDGDINLNDARVRSIGFSGCSCDRFLAWRAHVSGGLFLAEVGSQSFGSRQVILNDATIDGNVELIGARVGPAMARDEPALWADRAKISGVVFAAAARCQGATKVFDAELGGISAPGSSFQGRTDCQEGRAVTLVRTRIAGAVNLASPEDAYTSVEGPFSMVACHIGGTVDLQRVLFDTTNHGGSTNKPSTPDPDAEHLPGLLDLGESEIGGHLLLDRASVTGGSVHLSFAKVGRDARLDMFVRRDALNAAEKAPVPLIDLRSATVGKTVYWKLHLPDDASVDLSEATIDSLELNSAVYWPQGGKVWLDGLRYRTIMGDTIYRRMWLAAPSRWLRQRDRDGGLNRAQRYLLKLTDVVAGGDATQLCWLRLSTRRAYTPQPYDALAAGLSARGLGAEATSVLIARADDRRRAQGPFAVLRGLPYKLLVGNGFRTWLALIWLALMIGVGTAVFGAAYHAGDIVAIKPASEHLPFQPIVYSLDVLLPIIDLGQADAFLPLPTATGLQLFYWVQICFGWVLATAIAASAAAALQRRRS